MEMHLFYINNIYLYTKHYYDVSECSEASMIIEHGAHFKADSVCTTRNLKTNNVAICIN